jgi:hypothetical protein
MSFSNKKCLWEKKGNFWIIVNLSNIAIFGKTSPHIWYYKIEKKKNHGYNANIHERRYMVIYEL